MLLFQLLYFLVTRKINEYFNFVYSTILYFDTSRFEGENWQKLSKEVLSINKGVEKNTKKDDLSQKIIKPQVSVKRLPFWSCKLVFTSLAFLGILIGNGFFIFFSLRQKMSLVHSENEFKQSILVLETNLMMLLAKLLNKPNEFETSGLTINEKMRTLQEKLYQNTQFELGDYFKNHVCQKQSMKNYKNCGTVFNNLMSTPLLNILNYQMNNANTVEHQKFDSEDIPQLASLYLFMSNYFQEIFETGKNEIIAKYDSQKWQKIVFFLIPIILHFALWFYFDFFVFRKLGNDIVACLRIFDFLDYNACFMNSKLRKFVERCS